jgi:uncharacterized protein YodC (DUF2158 family)
MDEIKIGDTVRMKSGGPTMTVRDIKDGKLARCEWFDGAKPEMRDFALITLENYPPKK